MKTMTAQAFVANLSSYSRMDILWSFSCLRCLRDHLWMNWSAESLKHSHELSALLNNLVYKLLFSSLFMGCTVALLTALPMSSTFVFHAS